MPMYLFEHHLACDLVNHRQEPGLLSSFQNTRILKFVVQNIANGVYSHGIVILNSWLQVSTTFSANIESAYSNSLKENTLISHACFKFKTYGIKHGNYRGGNIEKPVRKIVPYTKLGKVPYDPL